MSTSSPVYVGYGYGTASTGYRPASLQYPTTGSNSSRTLSYHYGDFVDTAGATNRLGWISDSAVGGVIGHKKGTSLIISDDDV